MVFGSIRAVTETPADRAFRFLEAKPPKACIFNLSSGESKEVFFNPTVLPEQYTVNYDRASFPGLSHQRLTYANNTNAVVSLEMYVDKIFLDEANQRPIDIEDFKRFLQALCYPTESNTVRGTSPPEFLFLWPGLMNLTVVANSLNFEHRQFSLETGEVRIYTAILGIEEVRDARLTSEEVREKGSNRPTLPPLPSF